MNKRSRKLKVLFCTPALSPEMGGSAISEASLCASLSKTCEVTVLCRSGKFNSRFAATYGIQKPVLFKPLDAVAALFFSKHCLNLYFEKADLFHLNGHWKWESFFFALLCKRKKVPYVLHPRGMLLVGHRKRLIKKLFNVLIGNHIVRNASRVVALSHYEVTQFKPYPLKREKIAVIPNGITLTQPSNQSGETVATGSYFLYIGRIEQRKNLVFLIEAFKKFKSQGGKSALLLVGPVEHRYDVLLRKKIKALELEKSVHLMPPTYDEHKWALMKNAKAIVYPSVHEPFGRVPFEAVLAGVPPILPDESGGTEYLGRFFPECVYKSQNLSSLVRVMQKLDQEATLSENIQKARVWVNDTLNWKGVTQSVLNVYQQLVTNA